MYTKNRKKLMISTQPPCFIHQPWRSCFQHRPPHTTGTPAVVHLGGKTPPRTADYSTLHGLAHTCMRTGSPQCTTSVGAFEMIEARIEISENSK